MRNQYNIVQSARQCYDNIEEPNRAVGSKNIGCFAIIKLCETCTIIDSDSAYKGVKLTWKHDTYWRDY